MKKFLLKTSIFVVYAFLLQIVFPYVIDPFNVFHAEKVRINWAEPNRNYIKMKYILNHPNKFDGFMFGSSRVGAIHTEKIQNEKIYNMSYSAALPLEYLANIKTFINAGIHPSKIYIGIDSYSYTVDANTHIEKQHQCPYEYLRDNPAHFYSLYLFNLRPLDIFEKSPHAIKYLDDFYEYGYWYEYGKRPIIDLNVDKLNPSIGPENFLNEVIADIREIIKICKDNDIEFLIFTNPMHYVTYSQNISKGL